MRSNKVQSLTCCSMQGRLEGHGSPEYVAAMPCPRSVGRAKPYLQCLSQGI